MGTLVHFPTERYGAVTRATEQPHPVQRLASYLWKIVPIRARATLGCDEALEYAPNVVPLSRKQTKTEALCSAIAIYCHDNGYSGTVVANAISVGLMRVREGKSPASAYQSALARADFAHEHGRGPGVA